MGKTKDKNNNKKNGGKKGGKGGNVGRKQRFSKKSTVLVETMNERKAKRLNDVTREKFKNDLRGANSKGADLIPPVENPSIPIVVETQADIFLGIIIGAVSQALYRGWSINTPDDNYPFWALIYQSEALVEFARGAEPLTGNVPYWFNTVIQAIIKTGINFGNGHLTYNFNVPTDVTNSYLIPIGPPPFKHEYNLGIKTSATVNGLWPVIVAPSAYTLENGARATQNMWLFLEQQFKGSAFEPMHKMVPFNQSNGLTNDVSAYAFFENGPGGGFQESGAWFKKLFCESYINAPRFSVFAPVGANPPTNRSFPQLRCGSGDSISLGSSLVAELKKSQVMSTVQVRYQYLDCLEFIDTYAKAICGAQKQRVNTAAFNENMFSNSGYFEDNIQCPLTLLEFSLLMRASMMLYYASNMNGQGTYPRLATSQTDNEFVVYSTSIGTAPVPTGNMMMFPLALMANIMACKGRTLYPNSKNPMQYRTLLGQYDKDRLLTENYVVEYVFEENQISKNCFAVDPLELDVSLIDGSYGNGYVAINETEALLRLAETFNAWIIGMGDHFRNVGSLDNDNGSPAFSVCGMTMHVGAVGREQEALGKKKLIDGDRDEHIQRTVDEYSRKVYEERYGKGKDAEVPQPRHVPPGMEKGFGETLYTLRSVFAVTSAYVTFDSVWSTLQQFFIFPINFVPATPQGPADNTGFNRVAGFLLQGNQLDVGTGSVVFSTLNERHMNFANWMFKTKFAMETTQQAALLQLEKEFKMGILGKVASIVTSKVGHAAVDSASEVINALPF